MVKIILREKKDNQSKHMQYKSITLINISDIDIEIPWGIYQNICNYGNPVLKDVVNGSYTDLFNHKKSDILYSDSHKIDIIKIVRKAIHKAIKDGVKFNMSKNIKLWHKDRTYEKISLSNFINL